MEIIKNKKLRLKILKDSKKDFVKKSKFGDIGILYSRFKAKGSFLGTKLRFTEGESYSKISMDFGNGKFPANRREYGHDFITADGKLIIMKFKLDSKNRQVITEFEVFGGTYGK